MNFGQSACRLARLAGRVLGWRPQEFWAATPAELATVLGGEPSEALTRSDLARMMEHDDD